MSVFRYDLSMKAVSVSNPFHAQAEFIRHHYLPNPSMHKFKYAEIGDVGVVIGSIPHHLYLFCGKETKLFKMTISRLKNKEWDFLYGQVIRVIEGEASKLGYHNFSFLWEQNQVPEEPEASPEESRFDWESPVIK